jgi:7-alpha-hydroxysteroid dehydrogenase
VAAAAPGAYLTRTYPERVVRGGGEAYLELSGTSMSAAVVSGAGRGIGAACAKAFAEAGADVAITARTEDQLDAVAAEITELGQRALVFPADASDVDKLDELVDRSMSEYGRIDVVVNNVGGSMPQPLLDTSVRAFEHAFHFNVTTAFALSKAAIPHMLEGDGGSIVNISSAMGRLRDRGFAAYGTAKGALSHLTRLMAADCAPRIRVNAIAVGSVATSALEIVLTDDALRNEMIDGTPLKRLGEVEDIAIGALYLASDASSFVTGKVLEIDGGLEAANLALNLPDL